MYDVVGVWFKWERSDSHTVMHRIVTLANTALRDFQSVPCVPAGCEVGCFRCFLPFAVPNHMPRSLEPRRVPVFHAEEGCISS